MTQSVKGRKRISLKIHYDSIPGSVEIDGDGISYSNIKDMYMTGNGHGLQCNHESGTEKYEKIMDLCGDISKLIYELVEVTRGR